MQLNLTDAAARDIGKCTGCKYLRLKYGDCSTRLMRLVPCCINPKVSPCGDLKEINTYSSSSILEPPCEKTMSEHPPGWERDC